VSIGALDGPPEYQFAQIVGATRFEDSSIAVADARSNSIRFFSEDGRIIRSVGGRGRGPGEFMALQSLRRSSGDSLDVLDRRLERITVMDRSGTIVRLLQLSGGYIATYRLPGGRWLASDQEGSFGGLFREDAAPGLHRSPATVVVLDSTGALVDTVGVFPGSESTYLRLDGRQNSVQAAYGRSISFAAGGGHWYLATGDHFGFEVHAPDGRHVRSVRATGPDRTLRPSDIEKYNAALLAQRSEGPSRENLARFLQAAATPTQKAAVSRILLDPLGHVWLSAYENSLLPAAVWYVFDSGGRYLGEIPVPSGLRIMEIGSQYALGVWEDDSGVEFVRVYQLNR
jgi:hypothetical protein